LNSLILKTKKELILKKSKLVKWKPLVVKYY